MSDSLETLFDEAERRLIGAGSWLFHTGDRVSQIYLIDAGLVVLSRVTSSGAYIIMQRALPGQVLAEASAYSATYHCDARALTSVKLRCISVDRFRQPLADNPRLAEIWAAHLARAAQAARLLAEIRTLRTVDERLDAWLGAGRSMPAKGEWQDLAAELGVSREALYREMSKRRQI